MHYGFRGTVIDWFKSYLSNRTQYVYYNNIKSNSGKLTCGVPQGSILGPLLFILYINDIINTSTMLKFVLFADDTTILYSHDDLASKMNEINKELQEVTNWFKANKLSVNARKTNYMLLGTRYVNAKYVESVPANRDPGGVLSPKSYVDVPAGPRKSDYLYTNFLPNFPPISIPFSKEKHPIWIKLGAFYNNLPKIHPICVIWAPSSLMKTPPIAIPNFAKKCPKRQAHICIPCQCENPPPPGIEIYKSNWMIQNYKK